MSIINPERKLTKEQIQRCLEQVNFHLAWIDKAPRTATERRRWAEEAAFIQINTADGGVEFWRATLAQLKAELEARKTPEA